MRLKKIKLAGFKSFVDPTVLEVKNDLIAVIGPNGCGKSNVIDAVRWVMGESSAKNLRGESMADVIFNGSTTRKPVGQASIELIFDNSDGSLGGEYASYAEISVRRLATRDGDSQYFLNGTRCRRKDVTEVFLGTGLGPRSYSIIEQGMISRVIEAKPEELRLFLEEAAGISLYKERRRETEKRMTHTRENLERLNDLRQEQDKQLERLKRQSESAAKYQEYLLEQTTADTGLSVLKWHLLSTQLQNLSEGIRTESIAIEEKAAERTQLDAQLEVLRVTRSEKEDALQVVQSQYYEIGSEIARIEQQLQHHVDQQKQIKVDLAQIDHTWQATEQQKQQDEIKLENLQQERAQFEPQYALCNAAVTQATEARQASEEAMREWTKAWETFQQQSVEPQRQAEIEKTKIEQYERQLREGHARLARLQQEGSQIDVQPLLANIALWQQQREKEQRLDATHSQELEQTRTLIQTQKHANQTEAEKLYQVQTELQNAKAEQRSLQALQQAALGKDNETVQRWLKTHGLENKSRLAERLCVQDEFERAFEVVLNNRLQALCLDETTVDARSLAPIEAGELMFIQHSDEGAQALSHSTQPVQHEQRVPLSSKLDTTLPIQAWLQGIWVARDWAEALQQQPMLEAHESVITPDGLWLGKHWTKLYGAQGEFSGVLQRETRLKHLTAFIEETEAQVADLQAQRDAGQQALQALEGQREELHRAQQKCRQLLSDVQSKIGSEQARLEGQQKRLSRLESEINELQQQLQQLQDAVSAARAKLAIALDNMENFSKHKDALQLKHQQLKTAFQQANEAFHRAKDERHRLELKDQQVTTQIQAVEAGIARIEQQAEDIKTRRSGLHERLEQFATPMESLRLGLENNLESRVSVEGALTEARQALEVIDSEMRQIEKGRLGLEQAIARIREQLDNHRVEYGATQVRSQNVNEKLQALACDDPQSVLASLPAEFKEQDYEEQLTKIAQKIQRLGAINLAAIEEYQAEMERKTHLDAQLQDLNEALNTLEEAIAKINRETRAKFKETFDKVNDSFKALFPRLFGGGEADLILTGEDLLNTGLTVMARPPGKKNSSIHLLSGGEKALTAVALVFAIFQLNPAPFCLLDEVDAPLDDANVGRFCELVKYMSKKVQFIFITHNKLAMEMADQLAGVTMKEPGVSRLVAVDVKEAVALAAQ